MERCQNKTKQGRRHIGWLIAIGWLAAIGVGSYSLERFSAKAGVSGVSPVDWPTGSGLVRATDRPTVIVFAHPQCPCSRATLRELAVLVSRVRVPVAVRVLLFTPSKPPKGWTRSGLWDAASEIPGVDVRADLDGADAKRFDAATSGWTLLYDAAGRLCFAGGITSARGHEGDNAGLDYITTFVNGGGRMTTGETPVFGCALPDLAEIDALRRRVP